MAAAAHFFLGANSGGGFQSLFTQLAETADTYDLMILKGGGGVGKSTFLSSVAQSLAAEGERVEYIHCSGDPDSLDAAIFPDLRCAAVDGAPPHVLEPKYPAAVERIVDLGRFYDVTAAKTARADVIARTAECGAAGARATRCLRAARLLELEGIAQARAGFDADRAVRRVEGIIARELRKKGGQSGRTAYRFLGGPTCRGIVWRFDSVAALCPKIYELADRWELAGPLLERLRRAAVDRGWDVVACPAPEEPARLEHLLIPGLGLGFVTARPGMDSGGKPARRIRLDAMADPEDKGRLRFQRRMAAACRAEALTALKDAKAAHDALEAVYNPYVDFEGVAALAALEAGRLLSWRR